MSERTPPSSPPGQSHPDHSAKVDMEETLTLLEVVRLSFDYPNLLPIHQLAMDDLNDIAAAAQEELDRRAEEDAEAEQQRKKEEKAKADAEAKKEAEANQPPKQLEKQKEPA